jgi:glycosyltransferase involved in cell wall biosynthesis
MRISDYLNLCYIWLKTYFSEYSRWRVKNSRDSDRVDVFYGYENVPGADQQVFGGLVKLQDLQPVFPNQPVQPDLLYLVSSALPYFPLRMSKMAKRAGAKLVVNQNGVAYPGWFGKGWKKQNKPMQKLHTHADYVFYQSRFCKDSADKFLGKRESNFEILYNPVDTRFFCPDTERSKNAQPITLLLAGSHWSSYRPLIALDVLQKLSQKTGVTIKLKIAGRFCWEREPADAEKQVLDHAKRIGVFDQIELAGPYTQQQAVSLFRSSSILLHTKYNDPCPRLVVEAIACGLPVVYSASGGVPELVGSDGGVGVSGPLSWEKDYPPQAEALAAAVEVVIDDLGRFSQAARLRAVEKFDIKPWIRRHKEVFNQLLDER